MIRFGFSFFMAFGKLPLSISSEIHLFDEITSLLANRQQIKKSVASRSRGQLLWNAAAGHIIWVNAN